MHHHLHPLIIVLPPRLREPGTEYALRRLAAERALRLRRTAATAAAVAAVPGSVPAPDAPRRRGLPR